MLLWILVWIALFLGAGLVLGRLGLMLWRKVKALTSEMSQASEQASAVLASLNDLTDLTDPTSPSTSSRPKNFGRRRRRKPGVADAIGDSARIEAREVVRSDLSDHRPSWR